MITPRTTRLLRVPDLQAMQQAIAAVVEQPRARPAAVLVPTAAAGHALGRTLERLAADTRGVDILTRDDLYARLHGTLTDAPPMLSAFDREVLLTRAAEAADASGVRAPFRLRPGLIVEMLAFYDELRRRHRTIADFDRLMTGSLLPSVEIDRGAARLFAQTRFLVEAYTRFEALIAASGGIDEHGLRRLLLDHEGTSAFSRLVVTVADQAADARGLWTADFDLLARLHGLEFLDVIATEALLAAGFHQRVHDLLPGIEEERFGKDAAPPVLVMPDSHAESPPRWFVSRDREEELAEVARLAARSADPGGIAVVFQRPLPYLYLARSIFAGAGQTYHALDALPLAAEPFAAALDVVFAFILAEANRASTIDLLSSPHWSFAELQGTPASTRARVGALDVMLREMKYLGGWDRLDALSARITAPRAEESASRRRRPDPSDAIAAAIAASAALAPVRTASSSSEQIRALLAFVAAHERRPEPGLPWYERHMRARAAVLDALERLADAHARHDDGPIPVERLSGAVRRWIEGQTFAPVTGTEGTPGVMLLDSPAAAYAHVDELRLVGLVESDWPERSGRSIFYPSTLLSQLGWPADTDRMTAARARFQDLLRLPRRRVSVSTFTLEDDAIVSPSPFLEELEGIGLVSERVSSRDTVAVFGHELLFDEAPDVSRFPAQAAEWLALRTARTAYEHEAFHGAAGPHVPGTYAVSHVERYLDCPFKYFASRVLRLEEERDDESGLSPQERGQLLHTVFERFFQEWHARGGREITTTNLEDALELFTSVAEATLATLPEGDRALERTYLLGSAAAAGLAERAFNFEIEQDSPLLERLLEHPLEGEFEFQGADGPRTIAIRAKADRIDLLADGTLRVIDYKLSRAPKATRALQLPVYGVCAEQSLQGYRGRQWKVARAGYVAFKEKNAFVAVGGFSSLEQAFAEGQRRLVAAVDGIEAGQYPVQPDEPYRCTWCGYASVCRKDYVGDE